MAKNEVAITFILQLTKAQRFGNLLKSLSLDCVIPDRTV